jgi:hypothetical protein
VRSRARHLVLVRISDCCSASCPAGDDMNM